MGTLAIDDPIVDTAQTLGRGASYTWEFAGETAAAAMEATDMTVKRNHAFVVFAGRMWALGGMTDSSFWSKQGPACYRWGLGSALYG